MKQLKNIAIIAHVDHGKTTLIDGLLQQTGTFKEHQALVERVMDSMDLEKEKGITIRAKNASIYYKDYKINIVDTPGHADFGGEVERTLTMVEGVLLLVDAAEGPLPQTRFVLQKALNLNLVPIVILNKVDRSDARIHEVENEIYELFFELGASEQQISFPIIYASAKEKRASKTPNDRGQNLLVILDTIIDVIPSPQYSETAPLQMMVCNIGYSPYLGPLAIGKIRGGTIKSGMPAVQICENDVTESFRITALRSYDGLKEVEVDVLTMGDIAIVAGMKEATIGDTICAQDNVIPLPRIKVDPPTISVFFSVNTSPLSGKEGNYLTSRKLYERLMLEAQNNISIKIQATQSAEVFEVKGRGELQLCIIAETIRREGFELMVSRPHILFKEENGQKLEPVEYVVVDIPDNYMGAVTEKVSSRKGKINKIQPLGHGRVRMEFRIPSRGFIGYRSQFLTDTRGEGLISSYLDGYEPYSGALLTRANGALISDRAGATTGYAIYHLEDRGKIFVSPGMEVYEGMVVGEHNKQNDLNINVVREKKLTNMRAAGKDDNIKLTPVQEMSLEKAMSWIEDDEWIEITPKNLRLRKHILSSNSRTIIRG